MSFGTSSIGFDPADSAQHAAEAAPIFAGPPSGQDRYWFVCCGCSVSFLVSFPLCIFLCLFCVSFRFTLQYFLLNINHV